MTVNQDSLSIFYRAGNGGFYALWCVLLATPYRCCFVHRPANVDLEQLYKDHWHKPDRKSWAYTEILEDNANTANQSFLYPVFLYHNSNSIEQWQQSKFKVVVYTDIITQSAMSIEKQTSYGITCNDYTDIESVSVKLANMTPVIKYKNQSVSSWHAITMDFEKADLVVRLQDIVQTDGEALLGPLGYKANQRTRDFTKHYLSQHSEYTRRLLLR